MTLAELVPKVSEHDTYNLHYAKRQRAIIQPKVIAVKISLFLNLLDIKKMWTFEQYFLSTERDAKPHYWGIYLILILTNIYILRSFICNSLSEIHPVCKEKLNPQILWTTTWRRYFSHRVHTSSIYRRSPNTIRLE